MSTRQIAPEILARCAGAFDIPGSADALHPHGNGHINDTFLGDFGRGGDPQRYVFQRINTTVFKDPIGLTDNVVRVTSHLAASLSAEGQDPLRRTLTPIRAVDRPVGTGTAACLHLDADGGMWRCYRYIENSTSFESLASGRQAYEASRCFGDFLARLADLPGPRLHETIPNFHNTPARYGQFDAALAGAAPERLAAAEAEIAFVAARRAQAGRLVDMLATGELPERIAHNDTKVNNVLFDRESETGLCVIDLDTVMPSLALYDFGDSVRLGANPAAEDERELSLVRLDLEMFGELARGFLDGAGGMLTPAERGELVFSAWLITLEIALRFLSDFLAGDVYFRTHRPGHNLDRCRTQLRLVELIENHREAMQRVIATL